MAEATDEQMQIYADQRLRRRAESIRNLRASLIDDIASIDDVYARATGSNRWNDARTDPPHKLQSGNGASPDDMLVFNNFATLFEKFMTGTFTTLAEANDAAGAWQVLRDACVRPVIE